MCYKILQGGFLWAETRFFCSWPSCSAFLEWDSSLSVTWIFLTSSQTVQHFSSSLIPVCGSVWQLWTLLLLFPQLLKSLKRLSELPITVDILVVRAVKSLGLFMVSVESWGELFSMEVLLSLEQGVLPWPPATAQWHGCDCDKVLELPSTGKERAKAGGKPWRTVCHAWFSQKLNTWLGCESWSRSQQ